HVSVRDGGRLPTGEDARLDRPDARRLGDYEGPEILAAASGRDEYRPAQHRRAEDDRPQLAATARRQHHRLPVPEPRLPEQSPSAALNQASCVVAISLRETECTGDSNVTRRSRRVLRRRDVRFGVAGRRRARFPTGEPQTPRGPGRNNSETVAVAPSVL